MAVPVTVRRGLYEELNYYAQRAEKCLADGNIAAHLKWGQRWHSLNRLLTEGGHEGCDHAAGEFHCDSA